MVKGCRLEVTFRCSVLCEVTTMGERSRDPVIVVFVSVALLHDDGCVRTLVRKRFCAAYRIRSIYLE